MGILVALMLTITAPASADTMMMFNMLSPASPLSPLWMGNTIRRRQAAEQQRKPVVPREGGRKEPTP